MSYEVCIANIGPRQRRQRLVLGLVSLGAGAVLAVAASLLGVSPPMRLPLALLFYGGFAGVFQARGST